MGPRRCEGALDLFRQSEKSSHRAKKLLVLTLWLQLKRPKISRRPQALSSSTLSPRL